LRHRSPRSRLADQPPPQEALLRRANEGEKEKSARKLMSVARVLNVIGDWWSLLIIYEAIAGPKRFGELQRNLGVAKNILATRPKALSAEGIVEAAPASDGIVYQEYTITTKGRAFCPPRGPGAVEQAILVRAPRSAVGSDRREKAPSVEKARIAFRRWTVARCRGNSDKGLWRLSLRAESSSATTRLALTFGSLALLVVELIRNVRIVVHRLVAAPGATEMPVFLLCGIRTRFQKP
jgi:DNA-binding HxlR family transcriptional regulator